MNPLTLVKRTQQINSREAALGITDEASWHAKYKDSAYVYAGGIPFDLTEGDLLAVFSQYGEIVDVNLVRDKGTGKSKGFAFIAYEDQRSTNLAVDNLNGAQVLGRIIRVDHVTNYKKKEEEDEETERQKREARGVCRAFQRGQCTRGDGCKFSHDEKRAANTGWGHEDARSSKWGHDKFEPKSREDGNERDKRISRNHNDEVFEPRSRENHDRTKEKRLKRNDSNEFEPNAREGNDRRDEKGRRRQNDDEFEPNAKDGNDMRYGRRSRRQNDDEFEPNAREGNDRRDENGRRRQNGDEFEPKLRGHDRGEESRSRRHESDSYLREDREKGGEKRSTHTRDPPPHHYRDRNSDHQRKSER